MAAVKESALAAIVIAAVVIVALVLVACAKSAPPPAAPAHTDPAHPAEGGHSHAHHEGHHRFEKADDWAPMFDDPKRDEWQQPDRVVAALALAPGNVVADIGAGTGYFEKRLSAAVGANGAVIAVDVEPDMVRYLRERAQREGTANVEARLGTADDPKLAPASVDRILIVDTWHHVGERVAYAKKLAAALRPGGFVVVVDFKLDSTRGPPKAMRMPPEKVIEELTQAGLRASVVDAGLPDQYVIKASL
jgi:ubiquinone/menaquinone biosynthesis C-methylase UbiE